MIGNEFANENWLVIRNPCGTTHLILFGHQLCFGKLSANQAKMRQCARRPVVSDIDMAGGLKAYLSEYSEDQYALNDNAMRRLEGGFHGKVKRL